MAAPSKHLFVLSVFGLGYLRPAPGTWGSLPPVVIALGLIAAGDWAVRLHSIDVTMIVICLVSAWLCVRYGAAAELELGRKDPCHVVMDEVAGQSVALLFLPWRSLEEPNAWGWNLTIACVAFVSFRLMDIVKPPPARSLQRLSGGWGILIDDLLAGAYALALTQILSRLVLPLW
jgi:phosphatidylglycerophosphatase A